MRSGDKQGRKSNEVGLTLVGTLIGVCLLTLLFAVIYNLVFFGTTTSRKGMEMADSNTIGYLMMEAIVNEIKQANRIIYPRQRGVASWITLLERDGRAKAVFLDKKAGLLRMRYLDQKEPRTLTSFARNRRIFVKHLRFHRVKANEVVVKLSMAHSLKPERITYQLVSSFSPRNLY